MGRMLFRRAFRGTLAGVGTSSAFPQAACTELTTYVQSCHHDQHNEYNCRLHGHTLIPFTVPGSFASYAGKPDWVNNVLS